MESEETNCDEVQEKVCLKRKLTGPPRLLLGKGKDEKKSDVQASRKQRRDKNNGTEKHEEEEEHQGNDNADSESQQVSSQSPKTACSVEEEESLISNLDLQEECVGTASNSEQGKVKARHGKNRVRRRRAKAAIKSVFLPAFMCVRRRKQSDVKSAEDAEDNATFNNGQDALTNDATREILTDNVTARCEKKDVTEKGKRKLHLRIWPIFKRLSVKPKSSRSQQGEKDCVGADNHNLIEITSEKSAADQSDYCAPRPSGDIAVDEQLKGSKKIHEDMAGIHAESCPEKELAHEEEGCSEKVTLHAEVSSGLNTVFSQKNNEQLGCPEQDTIQCHLPNVKNEEDTMIQNTETSELTPALSDSEIISTCDNECSSEINAETFLDNVNNMVFVNDPDEILPVENEVKCKPVITIEGVHSSDEEIQEPLENDAPRQNTLSPLFALNGSCHRFKVNRATKDTLHTLDQTENNNSQFSDIVLVQTAFSLVSAAISRAMEQLSAELQNNQIEQDPA